MVVGGTGGVWSAAVSFLHYFLTRFSTLLVPWSSCAPSTFTDRVVVQRNNMKANKVQKWELFKTWRSSLDVQGPNRHIPSLDQAFGQKNSKQNIVLWAHLNTGHNLNLFHAAFSDQNPLCQVNYLCLKQLYWNIYS